MNKTTIIALVAALAAVWYVMSRRREGFAAEFVDQSAVRKTDLTRTSSYAQETNHFKPTPYPQDPIPGAETDLRVNMFNSYMQ